MLLCTNFVYPIYHVAWPGDPLQYCHQKQNPSTATHRVNYAHWGRKRLKRDQLICRPERGRHHYILRSKQTEFLVPSFRDLSR